MKDRIKADYYVEQFRQVDKKLTVTGSIQDIKNLKNGLRLTKSSNCITIAVWKIKLKPGINIPQPTL